MKYILLSCPLEKVGDLLEGDKFILPNVKERLKSRTSRGNNAQKLYMLPKTDMMD